MKTITFETNLTKYTISLILINLETKLKDIFKIM